jgi:hypothetical protein
MEIPTDVINRICPNIEDPVSKSVVYKFNLNQPHTISPISIHDVAGIEDNMEELRIKLPYSQNTFWTQFNLSYLSENEQHQRGETSELSYTVKIITDENYMFNLNNTDLYPIYQKTWMTLNWPFPAIKYNNSGVYISIVARKGFFERQRQLMSFVVNILGFTDIFPKSPHYILNKGISDINQSRMIQYGLPQNTSYEFVVVKFEEMGLVYNVEHPDYISHITEYVVLDTIL